MNINFEFQHAEYIDTGETHNYSSLEKLRADVKKFGWDRQFLLEEIHGNPYAIELIEEFYTQYDNFYDFYDEQIHNYCEESELAELLSPLNKNKNAIDFLKTHREWIRWNELGRNPNAIPLLNEFLYGVSDDMLDYIEQNKHWLTSSLYEAPYDTLEILHNKGIHISIDTLDYFTHNRNYFNCI